MKIFAVTLLISWPLLVQGQYFEGCLVYQQSVETLDNSISLENLNLDSVNIIEVLVKGDTILTNTYDASKITLKKGYLKCGCQEFIISHSSKEITKIIYPESKPCYEGKFTEKNLWAQNGNEKIANPTVSIFNFHSTAEKGLFWVDRNFSFKRSSNNGLLYKNLGLTIRSEIDAKLFKIKTTIVEVKPSRLMSEQFLLPENYNQRDFRVPSSLLK